MSLELAASFAMRGLVFVSISSSSSSSSSSCTDLRYEGGAGQENKRRREGLEEEAVLSVGGSDVVLLLLLRMLLLLILELLDASFVSSFSGVISSFSGVTEGTTSSGSAILVSSLLLMPIPMLRLLPLVAAVNGSNTIRFPVLIFGGFAKSVTLTRSSKVVFPASSRPMNKREICVSDM